MVCSRVAGAVSKTSSTSAISAASTAGTERYLLSCDCFLYNFGHAQGSEIFNVTTIFTKVVRCSACACVALASFVVSIAKACIVLCTFGFDVAVPVLYWLALLCLIECIAHLACFCVLLGLMLPD